MKTKTIPANEYNLTLGAIFDGGEASVFKVVAADKITFMGKKSDVLVLKPYDKATFKGAYLQVPDAVNHIGMIGGVWTLFLN